MGEGERGPKGCGQPLKVARDSGGPAHFPTLKAWQCPEEPRRVCGIRLSPALVLTCPQSPAVSHQAPREGPLGSKPRVRVRPQEHGRPNLPALRRAEQQAKVRAWERGSVGPMVEAQGAIKCRWRLGGPCPFPRPE